MLPASAECRAAPWLVLYWQVEAHPYFLNMELIDWCRVGGWVASAELRYLTASACLQCIH
jgi:hypothetical protein